MLSSASSWLDLLLYAAAVVVLLLTWPFGRIPGQRRP